ncbi:MAG: hypothetical protein A3G33_00760 [Omnitrophica bacterium RIFCSPLOWO2_12_FULL_44_17]|uniref:Methylamine utilisation protein MauE domain-containing protein n=1 Tax=Candidatus Danuiimicrobium aquiferis TaxID=1801832 RepID=A0A1G1L3L2_9BACT|nr:MAG: hypothetical protein A3B72_06455 [Omnitrophica bacterium RIFCSPHIGHO2_02_FULL_45_28]OGW89041.1 MAG: hypothetical protein A3E74_01485 [Omnitrophica bacterium RIFCSPHIGHO2_12_FULL_44_12]OGW99459.1 MAG: hypothetical protein A3G33_00760 [Omnitrophica bacterium RIFCSPLOWO2_12_FULL_44_17]OGX03972.1 MAG: hypothetical protein A3J12_04740 [Omnitrophica bacterium RIFCSPLOWO2_02_FULL_44_11]
MKLFLLIGRLAVGGILIYSGWNKLLAPPEEFAAAVEAYRFLPDMLIPLVATAVPWIEFILGAFIFLGFMTRTSAAVASVFFLAFIALLIRTIILKLPILDCGCFGAAIHISPRDTVKIDFILFLFSLLLSRRGSGILSLDHRLKKSE